MLKKLYSTIKYFSRKMSAHKISAYSAEGAFYIILSIFPFLIMLLSLVRFLPFLESELLNFAKGVLPAAVDELFTNFIKDLSNTNDAVTIISALTLLWSSSKGVYSVIGGLNSVFEERETRSYFKVRFLAVIYTLSFMLTILLTFILLVLGNSITEFVDSKYPNLSALAFFAMSFRFLIGFCMLIIFFISIYKFLACGKRRFADQLPGAMIASVGWIAYSVLFAFYIDNFSNYAPLYGSLTAVILLMLWLYSCMYILFLGAEINLYYIRKIAVKNK
ncbi:MAG TPA: YihY/virulence factor BrkB family protein [Bacillota bacterium]|nr:YihY/virulence factor BrkB family protein [Bacillota bacterium]HOK68039.1 YihY/virulence factor BrkB family protein [Bacillota bacterium]HPP84585.1 YihY/virulence factor BrkB family protein [Bacillota bacterium]